MITLTSIAVEVNPAPIDRVKTHAEFSAWARLQVAALDIEEYRPTVLTDFEPTPEEEAERIALDLADEEHDQAEYDAWLDRIHEERMAEVFGGPEDHVSFEELVEGAGCDAAREVGNR